MKVVMLAAGIGARLGLEVENTPAKVLLRFGGKSLLQHHLEILKRIGVDEVVLGVGHRHEDIEREIEALGLQDFVRTVLNENFKEGNIVTLWSLRDEICCGEPVLLMDADVLYDEKILNRLLDSPKEDCLLIDRGFEPGDEPVKVCVRDGDIIEFRKWISVEFDFCGESVGFFKLSANMAERLMLQTEQYICEGRRHEPYDEALRDIILTSPRGLFSFEDITGMPWIEIDFAEDVERAKVEILPKILTKNSNLPDTERGNAGSGDAETDGSIPVVADVKSN